MSESDMTNSHYKKGCLVEIPGWVAAAKSLPAIAMFRTITESELFGDQGGYPLIDEGACFIHEGRRMIPEIHGDDFSEQIYRLDGCSILEFE